MRTLFGFKCGKAISWSLSGFPMEIVKWKIMVATRAGRGLRTIWSHISLYDAVDLDGGAMLYIKSGKAGCTCIRQK